MALGYGYHSKQFNLGILRKFHMLISIILPVYNVKDHIQRCIQSIKKQSFKNFEVVFVDDCGTDGSIALAEEYAKQQDNVRIVYHEKNLGTYHARHTGALAAVGDYLVFLDPDDEIKEDLLLKLTEKITNQPDIIFYGVEFVPKRPWYKKKAFLHAIEPSSTVAESIYNPRTNEFLWGATPGKCYSKAFYLQVLEKLTVSRDFRFVYAEDQLVIYCSYFHAHKVENVQYDGYVYYKHESSISKFAKSKDLTLQLQQYDFFLSELYSQISNCELAVKERIIFDRLFSFLRANFYLISRHQNQAQNYLDCLQASNKLDFKLRKLIALLLYRFTFGKIKV